MSFLNSTVQTTVVSLLPHLLSQMATKARRGKSKEDEDEEVVVGDVAGDAEEAVEDDEESGPLPITKLEGGGITTADIKKLMENGFHTVESVAYATRKTLYGIKGMCFKI